MKIFRAIKKPIEITAIQMDRDFSVITLEGKMQAKAEDFLVIGAKGECYPIKKEIFFDTYNSEEIITDS